MKGLLIVFDGLDGSGKGTMVHEAKKFLLSKGIPEERIFTTAEPTHGYYGKKVRELLQSTVNPDVNARQFLDLYAEDRKEHIGNEILPALNTGKIILCDRYKYSTFVYQNLQGIPLEKISEIHKGMPVPDIAFVLDLPVEGALKRINRRKKLDTFEKKEFMEKVRDGFLNLKKIFPDEEIIIVDASQSIAQVKQEITKRLWGKIKES